MRQIFLALALLYAQSANADEASVNNAFALCQVIDSTGLASALCEVSGWRSSVTAVIDMNSSEARDVCGKIANMMREKGRSFSDGWTLQIQSPYSGGNSIAFCKL